MAFRLVHAGSFMMGSPGGVEGRDEREHRHKVHLTQSYYMQTTEVTQAQWVAVMGGNPSRFKGDDRPVEQVTTADCARFLERLAPLVPEHLRPTLPTEAEWEYACRAGTETEWAFGADGTRLPEYAWFKENSGGETHSVGTRKPNPWGFFDMYGNVTELCDGFFDPKPVAEATDPQGAASGWDRVARGGSYQEYVERCRSASQLSMGARSVAMVGRSWVGLRVVLRAR